LLRGPAAASLAAGDRKGCGWAWPVCRRRLGCGATGSGLQPPPLECSMPALTHGSLPLRRRDPGPNRTCRRPPSTGLERGSAPRPMRCSSPRPSCWPTWRALNPATLHYPNVADCAPTSPGPWIQPWPCRPNWPPCQRPRDRLRRAIRRLHWIWTLLETLRGAIPLVVCCDRRWAKGILHGCGGTGGPGPTLHLLGTRPYNALPPTWKGLDSGPVAPAPDPYTQAMFPMKFFE